MGNIAIFSGGFGSGKSEIALNYAVEISRHNSQVVLADLDMVNPYFCSRELEDVLQGHGIKLAAPIEMLRFSDVPQVPAEVIGFLGMEENEMILDVGGDEVGSWVLGYLSRHIQKRPYQMYLVINPFRPFAASLEGIIELRVSLEKASRLQFTGVISNPNMAAGTEVADIIAGHQQVTAYAEELGLPVEFLVVGERFYEPLKAYEWDVEVKPIKLYLWPEWL